MQRHYKFTVILLPERDPDFAGYFNALVPALPGCVSYGMSKDEALANIREAIEAYVEDLEAGGEEVPQGRVRAGRRRGLVATLAPLDGVRADKQTGTRRLPEGSCARQPLGLS